MKVSIFDIEANGLNPDRIWCLAYKIGGDKVRSTTSYDEMREFFLSQEILVGHNIIRFDIPIVEKILGIKIKAKLIDTLSLSWYLEPDRVRHGLEWWGIDFGVPKPPINNWLNLPIEEYVHRCEEDVKINDKLFQRFSKHLNEIYGNEEQWFRFTQFLSFKLDCAREQERSQWKLDIDRCRDALTELERLRDFKLQELQLTMPKVPIRFDRERPAKPYKQDGTYSVHGAKWFSLLREHSLPEEYEGTVTVITGWEEPNPGSPVQVKDWLFSLGWEPQTFKYKKEKDGSTRSIPQINLEHGAGLCPSIRILFDRHPELELLDSLGVLSHRISLLSGFLNSSREGYIRAEIQGLTNTLRFKHKTAVNLPKVEKPYGDLIRGVLIAREGYELCGADMASLEDRLKQHFIYPYDPEYVKEMSTPDYDPHLSLALSAGEVSAIAIEAYKVGTDKSIKPIRDIFKNGNYACQYGAGPERIALTANISLKKARQVWKAYWEKNWAIKEVAKDQKVKKVRGQKWLYNPVNHFYYFLREDKDIFSTLVQGTADYVFNVWIKFVRQKRSQLTAQFHDEIVQEVKKGFRQQATELLTWAINKTNDKLKLNRELSIGIQFGDNYSQIH